ncbi:MAG: PhoX family protein, partial [Chloroflexota bacterium]|nr:PhoX family protein [Chloroflexota bacterium]
MSTRNNRQRHLSRRGFLGIAGGSAAGLVLAPSLVLGTAAAEQRRSVGHPALIKDPGGVLDLPKGFQYRMLSTTDDRLSNGAKVPGDHDGMAAFAGKGGTTVLVRNHELSPDDTEAEPVIGNRADPAGSERPGGTTGLVVGPDRRLIRDYVTSSGTGQNCAGGRTPWGTWLTCEETRDEGHGYVYEVDPSEPLNELSRTPIKAMGFFSHEAAGVDPSTGIVYLTEDDFRGEIDEKDPRNDTRSSFLYRYIPNDTSKRPGALQKGGKLQALALKEAPLRDMDFYGTGQKFRVEWIDVSAEDSAADALYGGAARFNRLEGAEFKGGAFWFDDTAGGEARLGQIYRYIPATETLELFYEGTDENKIESPDNITITPWGDLSHIPQCRQQLSTISTHRAAIIAYLQRLWCEKSASATAQEAARQRRWVYNGRCPTRGGANRPPV